MQILLWQHATKREEFSYFRTTQDQLAVSPTSCVASGNYLCIMI